MKKSISFIFLLCLVYIGYSKEFQYSSTLKTDYPKGYQQVDLSPELLGLLNASFSDLRLLDSNQNEVPYVLRKETLVAMESFFREYPIRVNSPAPNGTSVVVFDNPKKETIDQIIFVVKNTAVSKSARLSGSDNNTDWFLIRENIRLHSMQNAKKTTDLKLLNFPKSDYAYFKLEVNDSNSLPIQFEKVGYYDYQNIDGSMTISSMSLFSVKDTNQVSHIHLTSEFPTRVERIRLHVTGPEHYYRQVHFKLKKTRVTRKGKKETYFEHLRSSFLNSNTENIFHIGPINLQDLYVEIENGDDQPLLLTEAETYFLKNYLVAELDPAMTYQLKFGNPKVRAPKYDLQHFVSQIPTNIPVIESGLIIRPPTNKKVAPTDSILDNKWLIWTVIGVVGVILAFISFSMIKEMSKEESEKT